MAQAKKTATSADVAMRRKAMNNLKGVVEAAYAAAMLDGEFGERERRTVLRLVPEIFDGDVNEKQIEELLRELEQEGEPQTAKARLATIAKRLGDSNSRRVALFTVARVLLCSGEATPEDTDREIDFYNALVEVLEEDEEVADDYWHAARNHFESLVQDPRLEAAILAAYVATSGDGEVSSEEADIAVKLLSREFKDVAMEDIATRFQEISAAMDHDSRFEALQAATEEEEHRETALKVAAKILVRNDTEGEKLDKRKAQFLKMARKTGASDERAQALWKSQAQSAYLKLLEAAVHAARYAVSVDGTVTHEEHVLVQKIAMKVLPDELTESMFENRYGKICEKHDHSEYPAILATVTEDAESRLVAMRIVAQFFAQDADGLKLSMRRERFMMMVRKIGADIDEAKNLWDRVQKKGN